MLKIVMGGSPTKFKGFIEHMIQDKFDVEFIEIDGQLEIIEYLKTHDDKAVLIYNCDFNEENPLDLYEYLYSSGIIPALFITKDIIIDSLEGYAGFFNHSVFANIKTPCHVDDFEEQVESFLREISPKDELIEHSRSPDLEFIKINIVRFSRYNKSKCNIYSKLPAGKFVKVAVAGSLDEVDLFLKYEERGVDYIYLEKNDYSELLVSALKTITSTLVSTDLELSQKIKLHSYAVSELRESAILFGFNVTILKYTELLSESIKSMVNENIKVEELMGMFNSKHDFVNNLSQLMIYTLFFMSKETTWDSDKDYSEFIYSALFCDIGLENQSLAHVQGTFDEDFNLLKKVSQNDIIQHLESSSRFLRNSDRDFEQEQEMIECHHELPSSLNYQDMSEKACLFNLVHQFSFRYLSRGRFTAQEVSVIVIGMKEDYSSEKCEVSYNALLNIVGGELQKVS